jgi:hypothetical protein
VIGRTVSWTTLVKNPLVLTSRLRPPAQEAAWAIIAQCPGGSSDPGPSAQW